MFARLTKFQVKKNEIEEGINRYRDSVIPEAKSQKGYCKAYLLINRETGNGISVTLWDCEEDAVTNEQNRYYQEQLIKFLSLLTSPSFIREGYEVAFED